VCGWIAFGSHGGALALVAVPEETPLVGVDRRSLLSLGKEQRGWMPSRNQHDVGCSTKEPLSDQAQTTRWTDGSYFQARPTRDVKRLWEGS